MIRKVKFILGDTVRVRGQNRVAFVNRATIDRVGSVGLVVLDRSINGLRVWHNDELVLVKRGPGRIKP